MYLLFPTCSSRYEIKHSLFNKFNTNCINCILRTQPQISTHPVGREVNKCPTLNKRPPHSPSATKKKNESGQEDCWLLFPFSAQTASCQLAHLYIKLILTQTLLAYNKSQYCSSCSIINLHSVELGHDMLFYTIQSSINDLWRLVLEQRVGLKMFRHRLKRSWFVHGQ